GVNLAQINFCGSMNCKINWTDPRLESALEQAVASSTRKMSAATRPTFSHVGASAPAGEEGPIISVGLRTLREILIEELATRFNLPKDSLEVKFRQDDERLVNLSEGQFQFDVEPRRQRNVGDVVWDVTIRSGGGKQQAAVGAYVRAWQVQVFAARPIV